MHKKIFTCYLPFVLGNRHIATVLLLGLIIMPFFGFAQLLGCTDPLANNYNSGTLINDGSCLYSTDTIDVIESRALPTILNGTSGLLFFQDSLLTHNDHGDVRFYLFDKDNPDDYNLILFDSITINDWEDIASDNVYFYLGDFGNNESGNRTDLKIFKIKKSEIKNNPLPKTIHFSYENQIDFTAQNPNNTDFDCEAFIVTDNRIFLFTKQWVSGKTSIYELNKDSSFQTALYKGMYNVNGLITGATFLKDKNLLVLSGYSKFLLPFVYLFYDFQDNNFFDGNKRKIILNLPLHQVEGITTKDGITYYLTNEKFSYGTNEIPSQLHKIDLTSFISQYMNTGDLNVENESITSIQVSPNPTYNFLNIHIPNGILSSINRIVLIGTDGRQRFTTNVVHQDMKIDISQLDLNGQCVLILEDDLKDVVYSKIILIF